MFKVKNKDTIISSIKYHRRRTGVFLVNLQAKFSNSFLTRTRKISEFVTFYAINGTYFAYYHIYSIYRDIQARYNHGQNIWHEIDKTNKTGQKKKSLISTFACFLTAIAKV